jgi:hypothetical protein
MYLRIASSLIFTAAASFAYGASAFPSGTYTMDDMAMTFADHGKLELKAADKDVLNGTWSADGTKVTLTDLSGSYACKAPNATGVYMWKADAGTITFTKQKDSCDDRAGALDGKTWKRKS